VNEVSLDKIVSLVVQEVVKELARHNIKVVHTGPAPAGGVLSGNVAQPDGFRTKIEKIDMKAYRSPVLTENHINRLHELTGEIVIPRKTILTPKARMALKSKNIAVNYED
jgi:hypothetical protein